MNPPNARSASPPLRCQQAFAGFCIGSLMTMALLQILPGPPFSILAGGAAGAIIQLTFLRRLLWIMAGATLLGLLIVGFTPLVPWLTAPQASADALEPEPAVVVLGAGSHSDATPTAAFQDRLDKACAVLRQGYAPRLLIPGSQSPGAVVAIDRLRQMRLSYPVIEAPSDGPVRNTHDEAVAVAQLAHQQHWDRVILVTHAIHMRRAAAVFEKAGIAVLKSPCDQSNYDAARPTLFYDRCAALHDWLHERIGYRVYRWRGWI